jgi:A/G-specific adenine glycosylase
MPRSIDPAVRLAFSRKLRTWYKRHARDLPWRRTRDAYEVLVSELMLQQTQVSRVIDYYGEFLDRFPTLAHVARCEAGCRDGGLGRLRLLRARSESSPPREYGHRRRNANRQSTPAEPDALRALPGIGAYTAGAVASFAYERRAALVDTNVARVLKRAFAPRADLKTTKGSRAVWDIAESLLPKPGGRPGPTIRRSWSWVALVCTARIANCGQCPFGRSVRPGRNIGRVFRRRALTT